MHFSSSRASESDSTANVQKVLETPEIDGVNGVYGADESAIGNGIVSEENIESHGDGDGDAHEDIDTQSHEVEEANQLDLDGKSEIAESGSVLSGSELYSSGLPGSGLPASSHSAHGPKCNSSDEFVSSDEDFLDQPSDEQRHSPFTKSSVAEHTAYFEKSLNETLDSLKLDDSLVLQAQLSGQLNKKSTELHEKNLQIASKIFSLKALYKHHIAENRIGKLESDIKSINTRVGLLMSGVSKTTVFGKSKRLGVAEKYPVEFNQARDKVLERVSEP